MADAGWLVSLHDPLDAQALRARSRAYALTHSSRRLLQRLGLWEALEPRLSPFSCLHLCDLGAGASLAFGPDDLPDPAARAAASPLGWIARHSDLMELLLARLQGHPSVGLRLGAQDAARGPCAAARSGVRTPVDQPAAEVGHGAHADSAVLAPGAPAPDAAAVVARESEGLSLEPMDAAPVDLILAADGPGSPTREALGIGRWCLPYRQACLTVQVELRGGGGGQAWELLRPEGPFAVLPLGQGQSQLVWSAPEPRCRQRQELDATALLELLAAVLPDGLEPDALLDAPRSFPVALELARRLRRGRTLLVGESAHRCHPVGGQGLNLCWRDVAELHRLAVMVRQGRLPLRRLGPLYARRRWPDLLLTLAATDLMVRLFSNRAPLLLPLRALALGLLARGRWLRRLSLRLMSEGSGRPVAISPQ